MTPEQAEKTLDRMVVYCSLRADAEAGEPTEEYKLGLFDILFEVDDSLRRLKPGEAAPISGAKLRRRYRLNHVEAHPGWPVIEHAAALIDEWIFALRNRFRPRQ